MGEKRKGGRKGTRGKGGEEKRGEGGKGRGGEEKAEGKARGGGLVQELLPLLLLLLPSLLVLSLPLSLACRCS